MEIPVKSTFFPPLRLSPRESNGYFQQAKNALEQIREVATNFSWKRVESKDGLVVGKVHCIDQNPKESRTNKSAANLVLRATTTVRATVEEIVELLAASDTTQYRKDMRRLHGKNFLDGYTLDSLDCSTPFSTCQLKWAAFKEQETSVDYCFLEYAGILDDINPIGFCVLHSINRPREVPPLTALGYRRDEFRRTGYLVQMSSECSETVVVSAIAQGAMSTSDKSLDKLEATLHHRIARVLMQLPEFVSMRRLGALPPLDKSQWIHDTCRKFCAVCLKSFKFSRKHHCRMCGEVVCGACSASREVEISSLGTSAFVRVCTVCVGRAHALAATRNHPQIGNQGSQSFLATSSFDVIDHKALINFSDNESDSDDCIKHERRQATKPHRATSLDSCTFEVYTDDDEFRSLRDEGLKLRAISHDSSDNALHFDSSNFRDHSLPSRVVYNDPSHDTRMKNVQEIFSRLTMIRDTLNQTMPQVAVKPTNTQSHILQDNPRIVVVEDEDEDESIESEEQQDESPTMMEMVENNEDDFLSEGDDSDAFDSPPSPEQNSPQESKRIVKKPASPVASPHFNKENPRNAGDIDDLRSQISELHRLLATANQRLQAVEEASTGPQQGQLERTMRYVELQSGNLNGDPVVSARRDAHRAVVLELRDIMGL